MMIKIRTSQIATPLVESGNQLNIELIKRGIGQSSKLSSQNTPSLASGKEPENCNQSNFGLVLSP